MHVYDSGGAVRARQPDPPAPAAPPDRAHDSAGTSTHRSTASASPSPAQRQVDAARAETRQRIYSAQAADQRFQALSRQLHVPNAALRQEMLGAERANVARAWREAGRAATQQIHLAAQQGPDPAAAAIAESRRITEQTRDPHLTSAVQGALGKVLGAAEATQHLQTLQRDFKVFDTANEAKGRFDQTQRVSDPNKLDTDGIVSRKDLQAVKADGDDGHLDVFTSSQLAAAECFLSHPDALAHVDVADDRNDAVGFGRADNKIARSDVDAALSDARRYQGAGTFRSDESIIPQAKGDRSDAQAAAAQFIPTRNFGDTYGPAKYNIDAFAQQLRAHQNDPAWVGEYFQALGSRTTSQLLYATLNTDSPLGFTTQERQANRDAARGAIASLQQSGALTSADLDQGRFRPSYLGDATFSLRTLLQADQAQQQIQARRNELGAAQLHPEDTGVYDAFDAVLTVTRNKQTIEQTARRYGVDPALLAGTVAAEMDFDNGRGDVLQDGFGRLGIHHGAGPGIANVHGPTLQWARDYLEVHRPATAAQYPSDAGNRSEFNNSVRDAAVVLAALQAYRADEGKARGIDASSDSATDRAVIWGAFRTGIQGVTPGGGGYTPEGFLNNQADAASGRFIAGGNAYQSQPYFELFDRAFA
jgi:hypothetical protein